MTFFQKLKTSNGSVPNILFIFVITILGAFLRWQYLAKGDFILNDGGMFYTMIQDLQRNGFILPEFTSYNLNQIPYAYPPLSFYIGGYLSQMPGGEIVAIFRYFPLFFNVFSIPAYYFLSKEISLNNRQSLISTAFYAILLPGFEWLITGGGLTRSPAHTYFIISLVFFLSYLRTHRRGYFITSILVAALMTLHHIEYCWVLGISIVLFSLFRIRFLEYVKLWMIFFLGVATLTAPYWITIIKFHGFDPFLNAFASGEFDPSISLWRMILMIFTREPMITFVNVLAIIGIWHGIASRNLQIPAWLLLIIFLDPRSAERISIFPVVLLASIAIDQVLIPSLTLKSLDKTESINDGQEISTKKMRPGLTLPIVFTLFCVFYPFTLAFLQTFTPGPALTMLSATQREAMEWITQNTADDSVFIVMSPDSTWSTDKLSEWFPALTGRKNLLTVQGAEWLPDSAYLKIQEWTTAAKKCYFVDEECIQIWKEKYSQDFDFLYLPKQVDNEPFQSSYLILADSFSRSKDFVKIFENEGAIIYSCE